MIQVNFANFVLPFCSWSGNSRAGARPSTWMDASRSLLVLVQTRDTCIDIMDGRAAVRPSPQCGCPLASFACDFAGCRVWTRWCLVDPLCCRMYMWTERRIGREEERKQREERKKEIIKKQKYASLGKVHRINKQPSGQRQ